MASGSSRKKSTTSSRSAGRQTATAAQRSSQNRGKGTGRRKNTSNSVTHREEIIVILTLAVSILLILSNFKLCGKAGEILTNTTFGLFGAIGYVIPIVWSVYACFIISNPDNLYLKLKLLISFGVIMILCGFAQMISIKSFDPDITIIQYYKASMEGKGGGIIGGLLVKLLCPWFNIIGTYVVLAVLFLIGILVISEYSLFDFIRYQSESMKENYSRNKELHDIRAEEKQREREERLEENRRKNAERMLRARQELEYASAAQQVPKKSPQKAKNSRYIIEAQEEPATQERSVIMPDGTVENPLNPVLPKTEKKTKKRPKSEYSRIPSFLLQDEPEETEDTYDTDYEELKPEVNKDDQIDDIILQGLNRSLNPPSASVDEVQDISGVRQMNVKDYTKEEKGDSEDVKTVITSSGKVIRMELGTAGTHKVEAQGHESDPHGTGAKYEEEEPFSVEEALAVEEKEYVFPPLSLLKRGQSTGRRNMDRELKETAIKLQSTLQNFGVGVTITNVSCGPTVTRYELQPEMGVKVSKIVSLQDDIKLNLAAADIRIEAPIPGKAAIGIEVPNKENVSVMLRDLLESEEFREHSSGLAFGTGKDIGGQVIVGDIAKMPHLLIAGATGSGKSVCINTIIISILYHAKPSEVKLIMIDPKVVELSVYNGIPHLLKPVVTDPKQAAGALNWAVAEMTERYKKFAELNVRDIKGYNEKIKEHYKGREDQMPKLLPQIVIIVDELADLMMVAPGDVEDSICRLAQMARAAGLHLVIATQRPSVNVITGVIKANVPSRIAFSVSSGVDSRTILDMIGAEKLLGRGDMLYYPAGLQKPIRVQGAFVSDKEVSSVVEFLAKQKNVSGGGYDSRINLEEHVAGESQTAATTASSGQSESNLDELFAEAGQLIVSIEKASIGMLQRKFRIGFNRAARIMDQLCEAGVVGEEEGTKPRSVLMNETEFTDYCQQHQIR